MQKKQLNEICENLSGTQTRQLNILHIRRKSNVAGNKNVTIIVVFFFAKLNTVVVFKLNVDY